LLWAKHPAFKKAAIHKIEIFRKVIFFAMVE
jgi:hypothetical protein